MNRIGFPKPKLHNENRIALLPEDIAGIENPEQLFFAQNYGIKYGISDEQYREAGANIVKDSKAYSLDVICQPKFCEDDFKRIQDSQLLFGWMHLTADNEIVPHLERKKATVIAWEQMKTNGKKVFYRNGKITGRIGVLHSIAYAGKMPEECCVAVIGRGRVGEGAVEQLTQLGVKEITVYHSKNSHLLKRWIEKYDVIVHCAHAPNTILLKSDLKRMRRGALFVHLGSDSIEGVPTTSVLAPVSHINNGRNPVYCINHVPTLAYQTASRGISNDVAPYIDMLVKEKTNRTLKNATVMIKGRLLEDRL